ncbi:hypothetical protein G6F35_018405 [Rhizopus arrhizus]|nr:hypothetical protein G6F35_018405 [Rhizopus arrhizus]
MTQPPQQRHPHPRDEHQHKAQCQRLQQQNPRTRAARPVGRHRLRDDGQIPLQPQRVRHGLLVRLLRQRQVRIRERLSVPQGLVGLELLRFGIAVAAQATAQ